MKVLIIGGGGREHALAWKAAQSDQVEKVFVAPGNAGTALEPNLENVPINVDDIDALIEFAKHEAIGLTIVGPEAPLVSGVVDQFQQASLACFGPRSASAVLEGSKSFTKDFLKKHDIPTAEYEIFTETQPAIDYVISQSLPIVIKADGLAAGKGVVIAETEQEAIATINDMLEGNKFGEAGHRIVVEEFLQGEEASFIVMSDGTHVLPLATSQDHKARDEGDQGPNTGGMGAYSPAPVIDKTIHDRIMKKVIMPTVEGMAEEKRTYLGFLYAGVMITDDGEPKVLEYNCRFGDPETQPIMMRLKSDLVALCLAAIEGKLDDCETEWDERSALGVVTASAGYPASASKGDLITGLADTYPDNVKIFHAGTAKNNEDIMTAGGRVLCVTALGNNVTEAQQDAYQALTKVKYSGMFFRKDIGYRAVAREKNE
ncbi:MAG: phosphoribosylamine--glycine ligase [Pseudomonadota bacterium]